MNDETGMLMELPLSKLVPFEGHPFKTMEDEPMSRIIESIAEYGVLTPLIVRPKGEAYEIISGHRRAHAAELAGMENVPVIVKN